MFNFCLVFIFTICLSILCVYASNIKRLFPHRRKNVVLNPAKDLKKHWAKVDSGNPQLRSNAHPINDHSWDAGMIGHA